MTARWSVEADARQELGGVAMLVPDVEGTCTRNDLSCDCDGHDNGYGDGDGYGDGEGDGFGDGYGCGYGFGDGYGGGYGTINGDGYCDDTVGGHVWIDRRDNEHEDD